MRILGKDDDILVVSRSIDYLQSDISCVTVEYIFNILCHNFTLSRAFHSLTADFSSFFFQIQSV